MNQNRKRKPPKSPTLKFPNFSTNSKSQKRPNNLKKVNKEDSNPHRMDPHLLFQERSNREK